MFCSDNRSSTRFTSPSTSPAEQQHTIRRVPTLLATAGTTSHGLAHGKKSSIYERRTNEHLERAILQEQIVSIADGLDRVL
jgi:hypothetical protein